MIESSSIKVSESTATAVSVSQQPIQTKRQTIPKKDEIEHQSPPIINNDRHIIESNITDHLPIANPSQTSPQTIQQIQHEQQNGYHHNTATISDEEKKNILAILQDSGIALEDYNPREQLKQLHIRNQSEIISKIPGINLFIRPFEELTTSKNEKMLGDLECRVMNRLDDIVTQLDGIDVRLDVIEQRLKESNDDTKQQILTSTDDDTSIG